MTQEEKVLFLFKLSVESAIEYKVASIKSGKSGPSSSLESTIETVYEKLETLLDKKLSEITG